MAQPPNPGPAAQTYSELAVVLAGFAFAALILYLGAQQKAATDSSTTAEPETARWSSPYAGVTPRRIVMSLFYAMSALTISAFLYGRLASESTASGRTYLVFALYGVVLALAVLSLFYAMNLIMVATRKETRLAAEQTRWVVAAVGPAVVISLLADLLASAWDYSCGASCSAWLSPRWWGFAFSLAFLVFGLWTTLPKPRTLPNLIGDLAMLPLDQKWLRASTRFFHRHAHFPAFVAIFVAALVGVASLWARGISDGYDPRHWTHALLVVTALILFLFAFAAGSVLDQSIPKFRKKAPRPKRRYPRPPAEPRRWRCPY